jgi:hypothetical protein
MYFFRTFIFVVVAAKKIISPMAFIATGRIRMTKTHMQGPIVGLM